MSNAEHLSRVSAKIAQAVIDYCKEHERFRADDLRRYVETRCKHCAPGSADRILRHMRRKGAINYVILDRRASLYMVLG